MEICSITEDNMSVCQKQRGSPEKDYFISVISTYHITYQTYVIHWLAEANKMGEVNFRCLWGFGIVKDWRVKAFIWEELNYEWRLFWLLDVHEREVLWKGLCEEADD